METRRDNEQEARCKFSMCVQSKQAAVSVGFQGRGIDAEEGLASSVNY